MSGSSSNQIQTLMVDGAMASAPRRRGIHGSTMVVTNMSQGVVRMEFKYKVLNRYSHSAKKMTYEEFLKLLHLYTDDEDSNKNDEDKGGQNGK